MLHWKIYTNIFFNIATLQFDVLKSMSDILPLGIIMKHYRTIDHLICTRLVNMNAISVSFWIKMHLVSKCQSLGGLHYFMQVHVSTKLYRIRLNIYRFFPNNCQYFFFFENSLNQSQIAVVSFLFQFLSVIKCTCTTIHNISSSVMCTLTDLHDFLWLSSRIWLIH